MDETTTSPDTTSAADTTESATGTTDGSAGTTGNTDTTVEEITTTRLPATNSRCMCVPTGSCSLVGGNSTSNDGSGQLDPRIVNVGLFCSSIFHIQVNSNLFSAHTRRQSNFRN